MISGIVSYYHHNFLSTGYFKFILGILVSVCVCNYSISQVGDSISTQHQIDSMLKIAWNDINKRNFDVALVNLDLAGQIAIEKFGRLSEPYGKFCLYKGRFFYYKNELEASEKWYLDALQIRQDILGKEHPECAKTLYSLALLYWKWGKYQKAAELHQESLHIKERVFGKEHLEYALSLNGLAVVYYQMGKYEMAEPLHLEALAIREKLLGKEHALYSESLNNLGAVYFGMGFYEKSASLFSESLSILEKTKGKESGEYAMRLTNLASNYQAMGFFGKAERLAAEAVPIQKKLFGRIHPSTAQAIGGLGIINLEIGQLDKAEKLFLQQLDILDSLYGGPHPEIASAQYNLGKAYHVKGDYKKAEMWMRHSLNNYEVTLGSGHPEYNKCLLGLAVALSYERKYDSADVYFQRVKKVELNLGKERAQYAFFLYYMAEHLRREGQYQKVPEMYLEAQNILERIIGKSNYGYLSILQDLIQTYVTLGKKEEALKYCRELFKLNRSLIQDALHYFSEKEMQAFIQNYNMGQYQTLTLAEQISNDEVKQICYDNCLFYKGFLLQSAGQVNRMARSNESMKEVYQQFISKKRRIGDLLSVPRRDRDTILISQLEESCNELEKSLIQKIPGYANSMKQSGWSEVQKALSDREVAIEFVQYTAGSTDTSDGYVQYAALVLKNQGSPIFLPLFRQGTMDSLIPSKASRKLEYVNELYTMSQRGAQLINQNLSTLYDLIWKPIMPHLNGIKHIYYSPSGILNRINLNAIAINEVQTIADRFTLSVLFSTRQLAMPDQQIHQNMSANLYGGLVYDVDTSQNQADKSVANPSSDPGEGKPMGEKSKTSIWNYLSGTEREIRSLEKILSAAGYQTHVLDGSEGTEHSVNQLGVDGPSPRILHFATHGYFFPDRGRSLDDVKKLGDPDQEGTDGSSTSKASSLRQIEKTEINESVFKMSEHPMLRSGLILSGGNAGWGSERTLARGEDGVLTAYEISQMDLSNTELVVLSACETGLGDIEGNEGVYGLQRAFKIAGVKYIIMSLWQVPDKQTTLLMTTFYKKWLESENPSGGGNKMSIPQAFQAAQKELREIGLDPYQWAGFVLIQ